jgi:amino acid transporter
MDNLMPQKINFWGAVSIGIGGMVGGGIFAVLGLSVQLSGGGAPISFAIAGLIALLTAYSYSKLSVAMPSQGGTVTFLDRAFKPGIVIGGFNILLWFSYIVMLSLYSYAFGSYGSTFGSDSFQPVLKHILISGSIILIASLNMLSADIIGRAETWIVGLKIIILLTFIAIGFSGVNTEQLSWGTWSPPLHLIAGGMIIFLAYEGFELIANTAHDIKNPEKNLPRAYFSAVVFVIILYILIAAVAIGNLPVSKIVEAKDYALAEAAKPFLGHPGFILIAVAALLSTGSAINATMYGTTRLSYIIAKDGELPVVLDKKIWNRPLEGLIITSSVTLIIANFFDLSSISTMGSAGFLIIFAAVNAANVKLYRLTKSQRLFSALGLVACIGALAVLIWQTAMTSPIRLIVLISMTGLAFIVEWLYRRLSGRKISISESK